MEQVALKKINYLDSKYAFINAWLLFTVLRNNIIHAQNKLKGKICSTYLFLMSNMKNNSPLNMYCYG